MANSKQRYVNTRFWNDNYVSELDPVEKLMFIYLLTNEHTNISGIYELPLKIMGVETGFETTMIKKILPRIKDKIQYIDGKIVIKNFIKHQETGSELVQKGILNCLKDLDQEFLKKVVNKGFYILPQYYLDTLSIPYTKGLNYSDSNSDSNSNLDVAETSSAKSKKTFNPLGAEIIKAFLDTDPRNKNFYNNITQRKACDFLLEEYGLEEVLRRIKLIPHFNKLPYFPSIYTPYELQEKWKKLEEAVEREQTKLKAKERQVIL